MINKGATYTNFEVVGLTGPDFESTIYHIHHIGGVMVSVLVSSVLDRGFETRSSQTKKLVFVAPPLSTQH